MFTTVLTLPLANAFFDGVKGFFQAGGLFMVPLAICAVAALVVTAMRLPALQREKVLPRFVTAAIQKLTPNGDIGHIWQLVEENPAPLARITRASLLNLDLTRAENTGMIQTTARREILRLERGLAGLELIVGISPLLGLLGAISGLVSVFSNLGSGGQSAQDTAGVALGIAEALNTTIFGLAIAIPTLVVYTFFSRKVEALAVEMESLTASLMSKCYAGQSEAAAAALEG